MDGLDGQGSDAVAADARAAQLLGGGRGAAAAARQDDAAGGHGRLGPLVARSQLKECRVMILDPESESDFQPFGDSGSGFVESQHL